MEEAEQQGSLSRGTLVIFTGWTRPKSAAVDWVSRLKAKQTTGRVVDVLDLVGGDRLVGVEWTLEPRISAWMKPDEITPNETVGDNGTATTGVDATSSKGPEKNMVEVAADRLETEGDIAASCSADLIGDHKGNSRVRKPFIHEAKMYVAISIRGGGMAEAYELVQRKDFVGTPHTYTAGKGYHGIEVRYHGKPYVLVGPSIHFTAAAPKERIGSLTRLRDEDLWQMRSDPSLTAAHRKAVTEEMQRRIRVRNAKRKAEEG